MIILDMDLFDTCGVTVSKTGDQFKISWTDYTANDWEETYPSLSLALARLAVLAECGDSDFEKLFANASDRFEVNARHFLEGEVA